MSGFNLDDYVDVAERIRLFYERYPDGRLVTVRHGIHELTDARGGSGLFVWCRAQAFRAPDDSQPCSGTAWEPIPGPTPYTKDSELMNAETAAWGRAIIAAGIPSKKIASSDEVRARVDGHAAPSGPGTGKKVNNKQHATIGVLVKSLAELRPDTDWVEYSREWIGVNYGKSSRAELLENEADALIAHLRSVENAAKAAA